MIAYFGSYRRLLKYARENHIHPKEMCLASHNGHKLQGRFGQDITIVIEDGYVPSNEDIGVIRMIEMMNSMKKEDS